MMSSRVKYSWNWNFADFRDLILNFTRGSNGRCSIKKVLLKFSQYLQGNTCARVLICNFKKETLAQGFSCEFCKIFKGNFFTERLWMAASILQQLLALYLAIIYSWQLSSSEESLVRKKITIYFTDGSETPNHHVNFENLNSISNVFQETHNF